MLQSVADPRSKRIPSKKVRKERREKEEKIVTWDSIRISKNDLFFRFILNVKIIMTRFTSNCEIHTQETPLRRTRRSEKEIASK
jgi:hypothetical protein